MNDDGIYGGAEPGENLSVACPGSTPTTQEADMPASGAIYPTYSQFLTDGDSLRGYIIQMQEEYTTKVNTLSKALAASELPNKRG